MGYTGDYPNCYLLTLQVGPIVMVSAGLRADTVKGLRFRLLGLGMLRVKGLGMFRVKGLGMFRVKGLGM